VCCAGVWANVADQSAVRPTYGAAAAWTIDSQNSEADFSVRHMLVATVRGKMGPVSGTVWYDDKDPASIRADTLIDVKKLSTGNDDRDNHLRTDDFFNAAKYPNIVFKSTRAAAGADGHFQLFGKLTIRDVTKDVALDVEGPIAAPSTSKEDRLVATATTTINRFDYGLKWNGLIEGGGVMVGPDVKITIELQITKAKG